MVLHRKEFNGMRGLIDSGHIALHKQLLRVT